MKALAPLLALCLLTAASHGGQLPAAQAPTGAKVEAKPAPKQTPKPFTAPRRVQSRSGKVFLIPNDCLAGRERYDLLVHFHGAPDALERSVNAAKLDAVVAVVNHGISSSSYGNPYHYPKAFEHLVGAVDRLVNRECPNGAQRSAGRVALSAWSAGYQAVFRFLHRDDSASRIDSVLLADGLHAGLKSRRPRDLGELTLEPFVELAGQAMRDEKLFALTHSQIPTPTYASTTETANHVLSEVGLKRARAAKKGSQRMQPLSQARRGSFSVEGYAGARAADHGDHLKQMGRTLLPLLVKRWSRP